MENKFPQKDKVKDKPKKPKAREAVGLSPTSRQVVQDLKKHVGRVVEILDARGLEPESNPLLTQSLLRATPEELDSLEERFLKNKTKPSPTE